MEKKGKEKKETIQKRSGECHIVMDSCGCYYCVDSCGCMYVNPCCC